VNLELRPAHNALRQQLDSALIRVMAGLAEGPRALAAGKGKKIELERGEFFNLAWSRCESFLRAAQAAYAARISQDNLPAGAIQPTSPTLLAPVFRERLPPSYAFPQSRLSFPLPGPLPPAVCFPAPVRSSPQRRCGGRCSAGAPAATAESIDAENPERAAAGPV